MHMVVATKMWYTSNEAEFTDVNIHPIPSSLSFTWLNFNSLVWVSFLPLYCHTDKKNKKTCNFLFPTVQLTQNSEK